MGSKHTAHITLTGRLATTRDKQAYSAILIRNAIEDRKTRMHRRGAEWMLPINECTAPRRVRHLEDGGSIISRGRCCGGHSRLTADQMMGGAL